MTTGIQRRGESRRETPTLATLLTIGYELSFFYKPQPLRSLEEISADILNIEKEAERLLDGLLKGGTQS